MPYFSSSFSGVPDRQREFASLGSGGRPIGESFIISEDRDAFVNYTFGFTGVDTGRVELEISEDGETWIEIARLSLQPGRVSNINIIVPKGYHVIIRNPLGVASLNRGQEVLI